jgi:hypothetical protein
LPSSPFCPPSIEWRYHLQRSRESTALHVDYYSTTNKTANLRNHEARAATLDVNDSAHRTLIDIAHRKREEKFERKSRASQKSLYTSGFCACEVFSPGFSHASRRRSARARAVTRRSATNNLHC